MKIKYLNGKRFSRAIRAACYRVNQRQQKLNDINVFPVPDSDTGTNMASTMNSIAESVKNQVDESIEKVSKSIALSALNGARGNSGAILAQFFHGFSEGLKGKIKISTQSFSDAVHKAVEQSYEALANPKEGTILTVIKDWGEHVRKISQKTHDFSELMQASLQVAKKSLEETPKKLKLLAKAGVVDAGALGFVYILEGITDFISNGEIRNENPLPAHSEKTTAANIEYSLKQIPFRYCTEFFLAGDIIPVQLIRSELRNLGDSLIVAGSETRVRVHIHTNNPRQVFDFVQQYGAIVDQKVDDMHQQHFDAHDSINTKTIALVTDSSCDLPPELIHKYNIHLVPLRLYLDETEYIDKVTIHPHEFYSRFTQAKKSPKTSQPTPSDFLRVYQQLAKRYDNIFSIHLSAALSGTYQSALTAARQISNANIVVLNSRTLSVSLGMILQLAGEAISKGISPKELEKTTQTWLQNHKLFVSVTTVDYLVKGGRVSKKQGFLAKLLHLTPVLTLNSEGAAEKMALAKPGLSSQKKVMKLVAKAVETMSNPRFAIVHVENPETAQWYSQQIHTLFNQKEEFTLPAAPVLGAHAGAGAAAVAVLDIGE